MKINNQKFNNITTEEDPISRELLIKGKRILISFCILGILEIIGTIISSFYISDYYSELIFPYFAVVGFILGLSLISIGEIIYILFKAKASLLNNTYRTEKLAEIWMSTYIEKSIEDTTDSFCSHNESDNSSKNQASVHPDNINTLNPNFITCPHCKRKQTAEHINCMICGKPLRENN